MLALTVLTKLHGMVQNVDHCQVLIIHATWYHHELINIFQNAKIDATQKMFKSLSHWSIVRSIYESWCCSPIIWEDNSATETFEDEIWSDELSLCCLLLIIVRRGVRAESGLVKHSD